MRPQVFALFLLLHCSQRTNAGATETSVATTQTAQGSLTFAVDGRNIRTFSQAELEHIASTEEFTVLDPYYRRSKRFRVVSLDAVLERAFATSAPGPLRTQQFLLRALDGFTVPIPGEKLLGNGALLALRDLDFANWEPIPPRMVSPAPFYLIWRGTNQQDPELFPRPYQLAHIEIARFETVFPHTVPHGVPSNSPALRGFALFRDFCIRCHAINREGGRVGPDLNVPQSIIEYRPEAQIRAYITNPLQFRYGAMPPHPQLTTDDLDALLAYFHAMSERKHDPDRPSDAGAH